MDSGDRFGLTSADESGRFQTDAFPPAYVLQ
jgi:hypothetical protein